MNKADFDEEANAPVAPKAPGRGSRQMFEAAALLLMWSVLALNEGAVRFLVSRPAYAGETPGPGQPPAPLSVTSTTNTAGGDIVPPIVYHVGGIAECVFGIVGLMVAMWSLVADGGGVLVTAVFLVIQNILGWYVFATFVFLEPAFRAARQIPSDLLFGLQTLGQARFAVVMGLFGSICFCLALQGGQFIMGLRLLNYQSNGKKFPQSTTMNRGRTLFWNGNIVFGGAAGIALSSLIINVVGSGRTFFGAPPFVGVYPVLTLVTGIFMVIHGALGIAVAFSKKLFTLFAYFTIPTYLIMFLNFVVWGPGGIPLPPPQAAAYHSGLIIVVITLGVYFAYQYVKETDQEVE